MSTGLGAGGLPRQVTSDTSVSPSLSRRPRGSRSVPGPEMCHRLGLRGPWASLAPANSSHPLGVSSSSANFPPPAGSRSPLPAPHPLTSLGSEVCLALSHCLSCAVSRTTPQNALHHLLPWSFSSFARKLLQLVVTGAPSTGRFLQDWPFLSSSLHRLVDSSSTLGTLPLLSVSVPFTDSISTDDFPRPTLSFSSIGLTFIAHLSTGFLLSVSVSVVIKVWWRDHRLFERFSR